MALEVSRAVVAPHVDLRVVWVVLVLEPALARHRARRQRGGRVALFERAEDEYVADKVRRRLRLPSDAARAALLQRTRAVLVAPHQCVCAGRMWTGTVGLRGRKQFWRGGTLGARVARACTAVKVHLVKRVHLTCHARLQLVLVCALLERPLDRLGHVRHRRGADRGERLIRLRAREARLNHPLDQRRALLHALSAARIGGALDIDGACSGVVRRRRRRQAGGGGGGGIRRRRRRRRRAGGGGRWRRQHRLPHR
mmetsp:Transcript_68248/g.204497  ORF Transcript_68248/g.204497 Transcript_68248/m.204497 type:complete len:254 (+) Transcript_68248:308-1069(+)